MPRRLTITLLAVITAFVLLSAGLVQANEESALKDFERKAPGEILAEVSGKNQEKVDRLVSELGLIEAAKKQGVVRKFIKALVKYRMAIVDYKLELGRITEKEAKAQKKAIIEKVADMISTRLARALFGRGEEPQPAVGQLPDDLPVDTLWFIDYDEYYHWQHNDDGTICK